jgi:hypothetical protein
MISSMLSIALLRLLLSLLYAWLSSFLLQFFVAA